MLSNLSLTPKMATAHAALAVISIVVADSVTDLGEVEFGEIAEGAVEVQQWVDLAVPPVLVFVCRQCAAGHDPPGFHKLLHVGQMGPSHSTIAGAFDASP